jgi:hypothetical protein
VSGDNKVFVCLFVCLALRLGLDAKANQNKETKAMLPSVMKLIRIALKSTPVVTTGSY